MLKRIIGSILGGLISIVIGCIMFFIFGREITLTCRYASATQANCTKVSRLMGITIGEPQEITSLKGASVEENCDEDGCTFRVLLHTDSENTPLTSYYSSGKTKKSEQAAQLNDYLQASREPELELVAGAGIIGTLIPLLLILFGPIEMLIGVWWALTRRR